MVTVTTDVMLPVSGTVTYIRIYAKQNDSKTRYLRVTLVDHTGSAISASGEGHVAYIRAVKPDRTQIFDTCTIDENGRVIALLSQQLLACAGVVKADIAIYSNNEEVLSSSTFDVDVSESSYDESGVISSDEFSALTEALSEAQNAVGIATDAADTADTAASNANDAAENAQEATEDALTAISAIYHDKNFIIEINEDDSLSLTYNDEETE